MLKYMLFALVFFVHTPVFAGDVYRWKQDNGSIAFADDLKKVPLYYRSRAVKVEFGPLNEYSRITIVQKPANKGNCVIK